MTRTLYAYETELVEGAWPTGSSLLGTDAHAVLLELSEEDIERIGAVREKERVGRYDVGDTVEVTDQKTGALWKVATAPCGERCHCATVAARA